MGARTTLVGMIAMTASVALADAPKPKAVDISAYKDKLIVLTDASGATYAVSGRVVSVVRKVGRRAGAFDIVGYELDLHQEGTHVANCYNSIVFPRRAAA